MSSSEYLSTDMMMIVTFQSSPRHAARPQRYCQACCGSKTRTCRTPAPTSRSNGRRLPAWSRTCLAHAGTRAHESGGSLRCCRRLCPPLQKKSNKILVMSFFFPFLSDFYT